MTLSPLQAAIAHAAFEYGAMAGGVALYGRARQRSGLAPMSAPGGFALMVGLLVGAAIGNKAAFLLERPDILAAAVSGGHWALGQSIVGGLLGGLLGIEAAKAITRQRASTGDAMVLPLAAGIALGRVGCFIAGLHDDTYGLPTAMPWGVDLGDGVPRHPAPLYEIAVLALLAGVLTAMRPRLATVPGLQFKLFLAGYLLWRLLGDALKPVRVPYAFGLGGIQWLCATALVLYLPLVWHAWRRQPRHRLASAT